jgi:hypothetical protein
MRRPATWASDVGGTSLTVELSETDWDELTALIAEAPPDRIRTAMTRVSASIHGTPHTDTGRLHTGADRLLYLAARSSGAAFDHALLRELRRLSLH